MHPVTGYRTSADWSALPKVLITCSFSLARVRQLMESGHPWFHELAGQEWRMLELLTSHWPMFSAPALLTDVLLTVAT